MFTGENALQSKLLYRGYQLEVRRAPSGGALGFTRVPRICRSLVDARSSPLTNTRRW